MTDQNCEMLFEYLKSILYDDVIQPFDVNALDEPFRKLGLGLHVLQRSVEEMKTYSKDLSCGNLSGQFPSRDNFLCVNLKNLHANLNHLTWQAKQVAAGDYSQHVSYLGEFSDAFNLMTKQLQEREIYLARMAFWDQLTEIRSRRFFMEYMDNFLKKKKQATLCYMDLDGLKYVNDFYGHLEGDEYIRSFVNAVQENLENVSLFARLGGDEFCLLIENDTMEAVSVSMEHILQEFVKQNTKDYPVSFSYGLVEITGEEEIPIDKLLTSVDEAMYQKKKKNKEQFHGGQSMAAPDAQQRLGK